MLTIIQPGVPGKATLYTVLPLAALEELNPGAAKWMRDGIVSDRSQTVVMSDVQR